MTYIEQAIKEAVHEGMWKNGYQMFGLFGDGFFEVWNAAHMQTRTTFEQAFLDPSFWQALGKARGWDTIDPNDCGGCNTCFQHFGAGPHKNEWKEHWHRFIDHLAEGKDTDSFFATLV